MTPERDNTVHTQECKCVAEIQQVLKYRPKPKWNAATPPTLKKHHQKTAPFGTSLMVFASSIGRIQSRYGVEP